MFKLFTRVKKQQQTIATQTDLESGDENINTLLDIVKEPCIVKEILDIKKSLEVEVVLPQFYSITIEYKNENNNQCTMTGTVYNKTNIRRGIIFLISKSTLCIFGRKFSDKSDVAKKAFLDNIPSCSSINATKPVLVLDVGSETTTEIKITISKSLFLDKCL